MSYQEAIRYLESLVNYEKLSSYPYKEALDLKRFRGFLSSINNPERFLKCIHVAGSKGKGSTAAFITYILREAGFRVGLYTSPHLIDFRERIRILVPLAGDTFQQVVNSCRKVSPAAQRKVSPVNALSLADFEGMISKPKLTSLVKRLKPAIEKYNRSSIYGRLTFFEACTALAFLYFQEKKVDLAVLETGLGGRLDATNVVNPLVSVITPISYEHMDKLGHTLKKIASEKSGIIKYNSTVISAPQKKEALEVIRRKCKKERARLLVVGKDIEYSGNEDNFRISGPYGNYKNLKIKLIGAHQVMNAVTALAAIGSLRGHAIKVEVDSLRRGLYNTLWPGRCELVAKQPVIVLDGAQNAASAAILKKAIQTRFYYRNLILVLGISGDKDIKGVAQELYALADKIILTKSNNPRATEPEVLKKYFKGKETHITNSVKEAKDLALMLTEKQDLILVTGSLYVVGEARGTVSALPRKQFPL
ncbi:MAG: folylpolyglutamate synthase/dihydrofolate synthase family protein [Candidatus Omnitrophota bacterium]|nr:folylpolyglutamate synthase/dihydrofolate synthase family protein [Candidatus Omnitrophota bacterium]